VKAEILAKRQLGALSARQAARIEAHMSRCAVCAETEAGLLAVSSLLAATRLPSMPAALVQRIEIVIASESTARAVSFAAGPSTQPASAADLAGSADSDAGAGQPDHEVPVLIPGRPDLPERTRRARSSRRFRLPSLSSPLVLRGMAATAAVVIIAGVGFLLANGQTHPHTATSSNGVRTASPGAAAPLQGAKAIANPALRHRVSVHYQLKGKTVTTTAYVSRANFVRRTLARQVRTDVRQSAGIEPVYGQNTTSAPTEPTPTSKPARNLGFSIPHLASCLSRINAGRTVLFVAVARFLGKPARIIVLRPTLSPSLLDIAIVGPACSASSLDVIFRTTIPAG